MHPSPPTATGLLPALRAATASVHRRLEETVNIEHCLRDASRYAGLLRTFLGFHRPLEKRLETISGLDERGYLSLERRKTPWIVADLRALGLSAAEIDLVPDCQSLPQLANDPVRAFGCLYVLEGATLGGRHITALLQSSPVPPEARRFFGGYGAQTGERWREFLTALEAAGRAGGEAGSEAIVGAACETFADMEGWIKAGRLYT